MMPSARRLGLLVCAATLLTLSACDFEGINDSPNAPSTTTPTALLPIAQYRIAATNYNAFGLGRFSNLYAQYWTQNQYTNEDRFAFPLVRATSVDAKWNGYYRGMSNLQEIVQLYESNPSLYTSFGNPANMEAIALILQAYTYQHIADIWGPAPFSEALQGGAQPTAPYDSAQDIYAGILAMLTRADGLINVSAPGPTAGDLIYGGNMARWKRFGNSLKMRAAIRLADVQPDVARTAIQQAIAAGPMTAVADGAAFAFSAAPPYQNPIFLNYQARRDDWAVTATLVNYMTNADPRLAVYADPSRLTGGIVGFAYGQAGSSAGAQYSNGNYSIPGARVRQNNTPGLMMLYDEVLFIQAEAVQRGFIAGDAAALYQQAIRASLSYWVPAITAAAADAFVSSVPYDAANWKQSIGRQKWVALYMQGVQGWSEWRRLDFGLLVRPAGGSLDPAVTGIPVRLTYPEEEKNLNPNNADALQQFFGGAANDTQATPLFWDVNPSVIP